MASKKFRDPNVTFTLKRDFGLSEHRLALPPEELDDPSKKEAKIDMPSEKKQRRKSGMFSLHTDKSATMQSKGSTGRYGGRMTRLMQMNHEAKKRSSKPPRSAPSTPPLAPKYSDHGGKYSPNPGRSSPSLHSRLIKKEILSSDGEKRGSLEDLKQLYGLDKEHQHQNIVDTGDLIRLSIISKGEVEERQVILRKKRDGLGMHLSAGPPPVYVEFTDRGGEAAAAGVKVGDEILEVNGRRCKTMQLTEVMQLKSLLQHVAAASGGKDAKQIRSSEVEVTVTSIDSDLSGDESEDENEKEEMISNSDWQKIQKEQKRDTELLIDASSSSGKQTAEKNSKDRSTIVKPAAKVELGDKEWEKMKEKQELIFNSTASSSMIVSSTDTKLSLPPPATGQSSPSKPKKKFSIFSRKEPKNSKQTEEKNKAEVEVKATSSSAADKAQEQTQKSKKSVTKKEKSKLDHEKSKVKDESTKSSVKRSPTTDAMLSAVDINEPNPPSRSKSAEPITSLAQNDKASAKHKSGKSGGLKGLFSKNKAHKTGKEGTDSGELDLSVVPVTAPTLGVREGRSRRDVGLTRAETKRRRPTNPSAMLAAREEALAARKRTNTEVFDSAGKEKESDTVIDPVTRQSSYVPRPQSGALSKKERQQIQRLISEPSPKPKRASISSAAMVAEAAALRKQKSLEADETDEAEDAEDNEDNEDNEDGSPTLKPAQQSKTLDTKSDIAIAQPEKNRPKEIDSRSLRRRKSVDMPVKVLTLERKHKEKKSSQPAVSPTSEKADAPSWVAVAQNKQKRSIQLYHSELPEEISSKKTELKPETDQKESQAPVGNVKSRMAMFEKK